MACPTTYNFVYLNDETKKLIDAEKKPKLDGDESNVTGKTEFVEAPAELVAEMVEHEFKIVYNSTMHISIQHLTPSFQQQITDTVNGIYSKLGLGLATRA